LTEHAPPLRFSFRKLDLTNTKEVARNRQAVGSVSRDVHGSDLLSRGKCPIEILRSQVEIY
jgi:hypothetical protein